jgi:trimeric autotransporter adhesin
VEQILLLVLKGGSQSISLASLGADGNVIYSGNGTISSSRSVSFNGHHLHFYGSGTFNVYTNGGGSLRIASGGVMVGSNSLPSYDLEIGSNSAAKPSTSTWTIWSDARLKDVVGEYQKGLNEILQLDPIVYKYKDFGSKVFNEEVKNETFVGFTAQEVKKVFPECVRLVGDGYLSLNLHAVNVAYINAIKELYGIVAEWEEEESFFDEELNGLKRLVSNK